LNQFEPKITCLATHKHNQQSFQLSGKNRLSVRLIADYPLHYGRTGAIELLPSDFILCGGNPIITDTIRFEKKQK